MPFVPLCKHTRKGGFPALPFVGLLALLPACETAPSPASAVTVFDSAGVRVVHSHQSVWTPEEAWRLADEPSLVIGEPPASPAEEFTLIRAIRPLPDGRLVVLDAGPTPEIRVFGPEGEYLHSIGRVGEGPGEFGFLWDLWVAPPDTVIVFGPGLSRLNVFTADGGHVRDDRVETSPPIPGGIILWGRFGDGTFLRRPNVYARGAEGTGRSQLPAIRIRSDGSVVDTLGVFPDLEHVPSETGGVRMPLFGKRAAILIHDSAYYTGMGDDFTIDQYDLSGRHVRRIRRDHAIRDVTETLVERERERAMEMAAPERRSSLRDHYDQIPRAPQLPAFSRDWLLSDDGHLWIQEYFVAGDPERIWSVFDPEGRWLGSVATPARFLPRAVARNRVIGVWTDDMDVQTIRGYEILASEGGAGGSAVPSPTP
jgi:hypothetical protein